jgi:hypothetical protein
MYLRDACKIVSKYGDMLERDCPGNTEVPKCWEKAEKCLENEAFKKDALAFRTKSYFSCNSTNDIKKALMEYGPVLASVKWYSSFKPDSDGVLPTTEVGEAGYHAIMIYGWDEVGFKCQNSWGTNWGNKGRFTLPYEIKIREARCLVDEVSSDILIPKRTQLLDLVYKLINFIKNFINKLVDKF